MLMNIPQSTIWEILAYMILTEYFWKFQSNIELLKCCYHALLTYSFLDIFFYMANIVEGGSLSITHTQQYACEEYSSWVQPKALPMGYYMPMG